MKSSVLMRNNEPSPRHPSHERPALNRLRWFVIVAALACCPGRPVGPARAEKLPDEKSQASRVWKVLMVGNSYTYFNNLPKMLEHVALADRPSRRVKCEMIVKGGATLDQLWDEGKAVKAIKEGGWDFVVLQEQSTLGETYLVNGQLRISDSSRYFASARRFDDVIRKSGARTVIFAFWSRLNAAEEDREALAYHHFELGKQLGAIVAPVGLAWQAFRKHPTAPVLYHADRSHPQPAGTYLAACVLYSACFGAVPAESPQKITAKPIDVEGKASAEKEKTLLELSPELAQAFRDATNEGLAAGRQFASELERHKPAPPNLPQLGRGHRPTPGDLTGDWVGETKLFPHAAQRPPTMTLRIARAGDALRASGKIAFGGKDPDIVLEIADIQITDEGISFVDKNKNANGGGTARYRAVFSGQALRGIAEITAKDARLSVIGTWELKKKITD
jgi:hypothetical protein